MKCWLALLLLAGCAAPSPPAPSPPARHFDQVSADPVAHGKRLGTVLGCNGCHGDDLTGEDWSAPNFVTMWTANLTRAVPRYTDAQLARAISGGIRHDGTALWDMPSHLFTHLQPAEMAAIIAWLRSQPPTGVEHPRPVFADAARREMADGSYRSSAGEVARAGKLWPPDAGAATARGRYIVRATCAECHGLDLRGGTPPGETTRPDLRIVAGYDAAQFKTLLQTGIAIGGREVGLMSRVARGRFRHLTDAERTAVLDYLHKVAEVAP